MLSKKELFSLRVVTQGGMHLGHVIDIFVEPASQSILQYEVRLAWQVARTLPFFGKTTILIHRTQVRAITDREIIVEDGVKGKFSDAREMLKKAALPKAAPV